MISCESVECRCEPSLSWLYEINNQNITLELYIGSLHGAMALISCLNISMLIYWSRFEGFIVIGSPCSRYKASDVAIYWSRFEGIIYEWL